MGDAAVREEIDLLSNIDPSKLKVDYTSGSFGFPSFEIFEDTNIKVAAGSVFRKPLFEAFAIKTIFKPYKRDVGFLFAVVNPYQTIVQFGLAVRESGRDKQDVVLYYTPSSRATTSSEVIANFTVPGMLNRWTRLALKVDTGRIGLYVNCVKVDEIDWVRRVPRLDFEQGSSLFIGQAGPQLREFPKFKGGLEYLRIFADPNEAEEQDCDLATSGSGQDSDDRDEEPPTSSLTPVRPHLLSKGEKGDKGDFGLKGDKGDQGPPGVPGLERPPLITPPPPDLEGLRGEKGDKGDRGIPGETGIQGLYGQKGEKGEDGEAGVPGIDGPSGDKGQKGDQGQPGLSITGPPGPPGLPGVAAEVIPDAVIGSKGEPGEPGIGSPGLDGLPGLQGQKGEPGEKVSICGPVNTADPQPIDPLIICTAGHFTP
ncbi:hypothetical protein Btru_023749 [Bulinus truncatus]|nr:hypothetical protein Btru_023749 [Bulinus truncatus]